MIVFGAMSGTSTDGVDVAAIQIDLNTAEMRFLGATSAEFSPELRVALLALQQLPPKFNSATDPIAFIDISEPARIRELERQKCKNVALK